MTHLSSESRVFKCGMAVFASALLLIAATIASADDVDPASQDPMVASIDAFIASLEIDKSDKEWKGKLPVPGAKGAFDPEKTYYWILDTNRGDLKIELYPDSAPLHVLSTIYLTRLGFYDDVKFHRIVTDFVAQGGDPTGRGMGNPGYLYPGEFDSERLHTKAGVVSMANSGPNTDGSQFFITFGPAPKLNGKHTIFGGVAEGKATVKKIKKAGSRSGKPTRKVIIKKATITVE
jgi:peptidyl-prolyl cis-trans isomerase B (cyclophilin B)